MNNPAVPTSRAAVGRVVLDRTGFRLSLGRPVVVVQILWFGAEKLGHSAIVALVIGVAETCHTSPYLKLIRGVVVKTVVKVPSSAYSRCRKGPLS